MRICIGGYAQEKLKFVLNNMFAGEDICSLKIADGENASYEELLSADIINHFHCYIRKSKKSLAELIEEAQKIADKNPEVIIISDEIGYGIVPVDRKEREYRENTGRVMCSLVKRADEVWRVICAIGTRIK